MLENTILFCICVCFFANQGSPVYMYVLIQYLYMRSVYICYLSKPSLLWSWTSVQSTAKVNTDTVNQYIDCDYRTSQDHIYL